MSDNSADRRNEVPRPHWNCTHRNYSLTCAEFDQLRRRADDRCEICRSGPTAGPRGMLFVDHDEMQGKWAVRGLLCNTCNSSLGIPHFAASRKAQAYLANPFRIEEPMRARRRRPVPGPQPLFKVDRDRCESAKTIPEADRKELWQLGKRHYRAVEALRIAREELNAKIATTASDVRGAQSDINRVTGLSRETIRQILLDHRIAQAQNTDQTA